LYSRGSCFIGRTIVVLDEETPALDPASHDHLMELLTEELSETT
jgi:ABC-type uncharacterized transport system fused permease/ATPase subunit